MTRCIFTVTRRIFRFGLLLAAAVSCGRLAAEAPPEAGAAFDAYIGKVEARLARQHGSINGFFAGTPAELARLRSGEVEVERVPAEGLTAGAVLHHWRGAAFVPGATAAGFERLLRDFDGYPGYFSPQVVAARVIGERGDRVQAVMRVRQRHVITVVLDTTYDVAFGRLDAEHRYVASRSIKVSEIDAAGTTAERALNPAQEHGFLWRLNTYWTCEERDGGLYIQVESVSLTRSIPTGLAWAVRPFVESVPRDSLEFTLRSASAALRNQLLGHTDNSPAEKSQKGLHDAH